VPAEDVEAPLEKNVPGWTDVSSVLPCAKKNIELISSYQNNATQYPDADNPTKKGWFFGERPRRLNNPQNGCRGAKNNSRRQHDSGE